MQMNKTLSSRLKKLGNKIPLTYGDLDDETYRRVAEKIISKQIFDEGLVEELDEIINLIENDLKYGTNNHAERMNKRIEQLDIKKKPIDKRLVKLVRDEMFADSRRTEEEVEEQIARLERVLGICIVPK